MIGENYRIPLSDKGRGVYKQTSSLPGIKKFSGLYELVKSNGTIVHIPFQKDPVIKLTVNILSSVQD